MGRTSRGVAEKRRFMDGPERCSDRSEMMPTLLWPGKAGQIRSSCRALKGKAKAKGGDQRGNRDGGPDALHMLPIVKLSEGFTA